MNLFWTFGRLGGGSAQCKASTYTGQHNTEKWRHTFMPGAGFKPMSPEFEWSKTVHALDHMAIGTSTLREYYLKLCM